MNVAVFGAGYVGSVSAACLADQGHSVILVDVDEDKIEAIRAGRAPIAEAGLDQLIAQNVSNGRIRATQSSTDALAATDLCFVCVGTPSDANGDVDLRYVRSVCDEIGQYLKGINRFYSVVIRSTMLPESMYGTVIPTLERASEMKAGEGFGIAIYPEFLRESSAIADYFNPAIMMLGVKDDTTLGRLRELNGPLPGVEVVTDIKTTEAVKYTNNAWHATKVTFANEIGNLCRSVGVDGHRVMEILCKDNRLNISSTYMKPGFAFGGSCLPKDLRALVALGQRKGVKTPVFDSLLDANNQQVDRALTMVRETGHSRIGLLGLTFKYGTDDLRESPLVTLAERLVSNGFDLKIYDENVKPEKSRLNGLTACMAASLDDVYDHAEVIVIGNGAPVFRSAVARAEQGIDVIDLVRVDPAKTSAENYHGICW